MFAAQADGQKIARNNGSLALSAMHLLRMCSMLVPSEFSHFAKTAREKKLCFCSFPEISCISESEKNHRALQGGPRGGDKFTSLFQALQSLYSKRQKHPFLPSRVVTPSGAPRQAPLEKSYRNFSAVHILI